MITVYNIQNLESFFHTIDDFKNPVILQTKKGEYQDLRKNDILQEILFSVAGEKGLEQICLNVEGEEDIDKMITFLLDKNKKYS